jgi:hypothetical protein
MNPTLENIFSEIGGGFRVDYGISTFSKKYGDFMIDYAGTLGGGIRIHLREKDDHFSVGYTNWCIGTQYQLIVPLTKFICEMVDIGREADLPDYSKSKPLYWDVSFLNRLRLAGLKGDNEMLNAILDLFQKRINFQQVVDIFLKNGVPKTEILFKQDELLPYDNSGWRFKI